MQRRGTEQEQPSRRKRTEARKKERGNPGPGCQKDSEQERTGKIPTY